MLSIKKKMVSKMADIKNYYYLKVKDNFYESEEMILLQNMQDGYLYSDILMKLYLRSLKNQGKLMFKDVIPYSPELLAQVVRHQVGTVKQALQIFQNLGLIEILDNGAIYMLDIQNFIGKSSTEADRKREYRMQIDAEKERQRQLSGQMSGKTTPKIEKEIEIKKELEKEIEKENNQSLLPIPSSNSKLKKQYEEEFEKLWSVYPNKKGKEEARKKYISYRKNGTSYEEVASGLKKYIEYCKVEIKETKYIKHGSTWFNQQCWNDEYIITNNSNKKVDSQMELLKGVYNGTIKIN